jgi:thiamine biosynthesis lipoprotein ApbE
MDADADNLLPEADANSISLLQTLTPLLIALGTPTSMSFSTPTAPLTTAVVESVSTSAKLEHLPTTSALAAVHISALECLSNLLLSFPAGDSGPINPTVLGSAVAAWPQAWNVLNTALEAPSSADRRMEVAVAALGVLWGFARLARGTLVPEQAHVEVLIQIADSPQADEQVQVKCVGILGSLAQNLKEVEMNRVSDCITHTRLVVCY